MRNKNQFVFINYLIRKGFIKVIDEDNELYVGSHGDIGSTAATELVLNSDLLIVIGSSFSDMTHLPVKKAVQIDIDPLMIGRQYPVEVGLYGNSAEIIPGWFL